MGVAKTHLSPGILYGAVVPVALAAGVSLVSVLQTGDWTRDSTPVKTYFSTYIITSNHHQDSIQSTVLASVSSLLVGRCQTMAYIKSCKYVWL